MAERDAYQRLGGGSGTAKCEHGERAIGEIANRGRSIRTGGGILKGVDRGAEITAKLADPPIVLRGGIRSGGGDRTQRQQDGNKFH